jgi:ribosomal protein S18 acetylase RimI-like enzyme
VAAAPRMRPGGARLNRLRAVSGTRPANDQDIKPMAAALARAFDDDPAMIWLFGEHQRRRSSRLRRFFSYDAQRHRVHGQVLTTPAHEGGAFWDAPGHWKESWVDVLKSLPVMGPAVGPRLRRALRGLGMIERAHPREPHWYLAVLGTDPSAQGRGVAGRLIQPVLDRCDHQQLGAYLESSKEQNIAYYARFGFEVTGEITLPDGPPIWPMWRAPRAS